MATQENQSQLDIPGYIADVKHIEKAKEKLEELKTSGVFKLLVYSKLLETLNEEGDPLAVLSKARAYANLLLEPQKNRESIKPVIKSF